MWSPDLQMDVRDMSFFPDESFDAVIDKGNAIALPHVLFLVIFPSLTVFFFPRILIFCGISSGH